MTLTETVHIWGDIDIEVDYTVHPADPDTGIMSPYVENWDITYLGEKKLSPGFAAALAKELEADKHAFNLFIEKLPTTVEQD